MNCAEKLLEPTIFQLMHQVTIEFRFRKSLAQERFKSYLTHIIKNYTKFIRGTNFRVKMLLLRQPLFQDIFRVLLRRPKYFLNHGKVPFFDLLVRKDLRDRVNSLV